MIKRIIALIASLAVVIGLMASQSSYAWFVTAVKKAQNITIAVMSYTSSSAALETLEEDFYGKPCIYPGQNLIKLQGDDAQITMFNNSTIDTQIRVRIEYTSYKNGRAETKVYSNSEDDDLQVEFTHPGQWLPYETDMSGYCYYYVGPDFNATELKSLDDVHVITPDEANVNILSNVSYKNDIDTSLYSGNEVTVNIIFEAKQADYVGWTSLGEYTLATDVG